VNRLLRFGLTGLLTTGIAFVVFVGLPYLGVHYLIASVLSWASSLTVGFLMNRRFTFGISGGEKRGRDFGFYMLGAVLQMLLGLAVYRVLIGQWRLDRPLAFAINLIFTTGFSFLFMRFVTFRRVARPVQPVD
jgi:putative flippase GtrA